MFTDIEDLLELDELDAVVIATPNHLHEPHVLSALASKSHVLCERPLSLTSRGVERILSAAARADRTVTVGNNHRYRTDVQTLSRFIQGGELGKMVGMRAGAYHFKRPPKAGAIVARSRAAARSSITACRCSISRCGSPTIRIRCA